MDLSQITPLMLTFNESANISRTLAPLAWARRIVILDSGSSDDTIAIVGSFPSVSVHRREFDSHTAQWNYGIDLVETEWVLAFDADYVVDELFRTELEALDARSGIDTFFANFTYCVFGRPLRASLYPPRAVLYRRSAARYVQDGHTQLLEFDGKADKLRSTIRHDDRKPLAQWLRAQDRYARLEMEKLTGSGATGFKDSSRKWILAAPFLTFFYCLFGKGLVLDGWAGWYYTFQRTVAELILSLRLIEQKFMR